MISKEELMTELERIDVDIERHEHKLELLNEARRELVNYLGLNKDNPEL